MKKMLILILFLSSTVSFSQGLNISISYLNGEKSKDSHSTEESYAIGGYEAVYSVKYSGHTSGDKKDGDKTCRLSEENVILVKDFIFEKGLNKDATLRDESTKYKSFEIFVNITVNMKIDGSEYKISINGDTDEIGHKDLYKNVVALIDKIRVMIKDC